MVNLYIFYFSFFPEMQHLQTGLWFDCDNITQQGCWAQPWFEEAVLTL